MQAQRCTVYGVRDERMGWGVASPSPAPAVVSLCSPASARVVALVHLRSSDHEWTSGFTLDAVLSHTSLDLPAPVFALLHVA